jgi:hypothetical protein
VEKNPMNSMTPGGADLEEWILAKQNLADAELDRFDDARQNGSRRANLDRAEPDEFDDTRWQILIQSKVRTSCMATAHPHAVTHDRESQWKREEEWLAAVTKCNEKKSLGENHNFWLFIPWYE